MTYLLFFGSYLFGSIPFGLILGKVFRGVDLRTVGSGNIGASNAMRVLGWKIGIPVFALDVVKGVAPVLVAQRFAPFDRDLFTVACGIAAILGHNCSPFLKFKGGKGVATSLGVCLAMSWKAGVVGFSLWCFVLIVTRFISISSLIATPTGAICIWLDNGRTWPYAVFAAIASVFVIVKHISNIKRLIAGKEPRTQPLQATIDKLLKRKSESESES
jgi:glycerol-3-phosphate acyltransferase PlsY